MTIKKEIVCFIETNEENEFVKINALETDPGYYLLTLGQNRIVISGQEMIEALHTIDQFATMFAQEREAKILRKNAPPKAMSINPVTPIKRSKKVSSEDEGAIVLDPVLRMGPTASELALEAQTKHMKGETIVVSEKK